MVNKTAPVDHSNQYCALKKKFGNLSRTFLPVILPEFILMTSNGTAFLFGCGLRERYVLANIVFVKLRSNYIHIAMFFKPGSKGFRLL
jgi:hypothetical protein